MNRRVCRENPHQLIQHIFCKLQHLRVLYVQDIAPALRLLQRELRQSEMWVSHQRGKGMAGQVPSGSTITWRSRA